MGGREENPGLLVGGWGQLVGTGGCVCSGWEWEPAACIGAGAGVRSGIPGGQGEPEGVQGLGVGARAEGESLGGSS